MGAMGPCIKKPRFEARPIQEKVPMYTGSVMCKKKADPDGKIHREEETKEAPMVVGCESSEIHDANHLCTAD